MAVADLIRYPDSVSLSYRLVHALFAPEIAPEHLFNLLTWPQTHHHLQGSLHSDHIIFPHGDISLLNHSLTSPFASLSMTLLSLSCLTSSFNCGPKDTPVLLAQHLHISDEAAS